MYKGKVLPPVYLIAFFIVQVILYKFFSFYSFKSSLSQVAGILLLFSGMSFILLSSQLFRKRSTTIMPFKESHYLISSGPFRWSRNPIYLGMFFLLLGSGLLFAELLTLVMPFLFYWTIDQRVIPLEEKMLSESFGEKYNTYRGHVNRWL